MNLNHIPEDAKRREEIKQEINERAESFALHYDEEALKRHDVRMKAPMLFILLGDKVQDGFEIIKQAIGRRISNSEGIIYLSITTDEEKEDTLQVVSLSLKEQVHSEESSIENISANQGTTYSKEYVGQLNDSDKIDDTDDLRNQDITRSKGIRGQFDKCFDSNSFLEKLNKKLALVTQRILEQNKVFSYWEQIHVAVITEASEDANVILSDLMVLLKSKLEQNFKQVFSDLFVLLEETTEKASTMNKAQAYSLFQELDLYQNRQYQYARPTEVLEGNMKIMITHKGKLFHLVYILSDKKENGQRIQEARKSHYESIVAINFLKNREQKSVELEEAREQYSYNTFIANIQEGAENRYATARLAKVRKPRQGIYLAVLYHLFKAYKNELSYEGEGAQQSLLHQVGLSEEKIETYIRQWMPECSGLEEIKSIISKPTSFRVLKDCTFAEAEKELYGEMVRAFFEANFTKPAISRMTQELSTEKLRVKLTESVISHPQYGPFALGKLLQSDAYKKIEAQKEKYLYQIKQKQMEIDEEMNRIVGECVGGNFTLFDKKYLQEVKKHFIKTIYQRHYEYVVETLKLKALQKLQEEIEQFNEGLKAQVKKLEQVENLLLEMIEEANRYEEDYLVQNVKEYYQRVVNWQLEALKKTKGEHFLQDEKYMGSSAHLLAQSEIDMVRKIMMIAETEFLKEEKYFNISFEEELLARANMHIAYTDTEVVAKTELYELLYESLEENSKPCVYLDTTFGTYQYVEKYFISSRQSEFTAYAYKRDQGSRNYKIGTISDQRNSEIEKLQLMGGFKLQDLVYMRSAKHYYEAYKAQGYLFHSEAIEKILNKEEQ